jgi:phage gpG-like protein
MAKSISALVNSKISRVRMAVNGLPTVLGNAAVNYSLDRFAAQSWIGSGVEQWPARKNKKKTGKILIQSGRLRRATKIISATNDSVVVGNNIPYARIHNYGFKGTVQVKSHTRGRFVTHGRSGTKLTKKINNRAMSVKGKIGGKPVVPHGRRINMPRRQFIGNSPYVRTYLARQGRLFLMKNLKL